jgi:hypothetical protein
MCWKTSKGGEYERVLIELEGEFASQRVEGYLYLRDLSGRPDVRARAGSNVVRTVLCAALRARMATL